MEQIQVLDRELELDPCLTDGDVATVVSLIEALKQALDMARRDIVELKASTAA